MACRMRASVVGSLWEAYAATSRLIIEGSRCSRRPSSRARKTNFCADVIDMSAGSVIQFIF